MSKRKCTRCHHMFTPVVHNEHAFRWDYELDRFVELTPYTDPHPQCRKCRDEVFYEEHPEYRQKLYDYAFLDWYDEQLRKIAAEEW